MHALFNCAMMKNRGMRLSKNAQGGRTSFYRRERGIHAGYSLEISPSCAPSLSTKRVVARRRGAFVFLELSEIWAFEASGRLTFVHSRHGTFDVDVSLTAIQASIGAGFIRAHRNWLVNAAQIKTLERSAGDTTLFVGAEIGQDSVGICVPVARTRAAYLRERLLGDAIGVRRQE